VLGVPDLLTSTPDPFPIGYPDVPSKEGVRRPLEDMVHYDIRPRHMSKILSTNRPCNKPLSLYSITARKDRAGVSHSYTRHRRKRRSSLLPLRLRGRAGWGRATISITSGAKPGGHPPRRALSTSPASGRGGKARSSWDDHSLLPVLKNARDRRLIATLVGCACGPALALEGAGSARSDREIDGFFSLRP